MEVHQRTLLAFHDTGLAHGVTDAVWASSLLNRRVHGAGGLVNHTLQALCLGKRDLVYVTEVERL